MTIAGTMDGLNHKNPFSGLNETDEQKKQRKLNKELLKCTDRKAIKNATSCDAGVFIKSCDLKYFSSANLFYTCTEFKQKFLYSFYVESVTEDGKEMVTSVDTVTKSK